MQSNESIRILLYRLWQHVSTRRRRQFSLLLILMLFASFAEIFSIGAVFPFLAVLTSPASVFEHSAAQPFIQMFDLTKPEQLLLPISIAFGLAALFASALRLLLLWVNTRLSFATGADLGISIYRRTLFQPYSVHCARNSSEVISAISGKSNSVILSIIFPFLTLISSSVMLSIILFAILSVEPITALIVFGGFGSIYAIFILLTRKQLFKNSQCISRESVQVIKSLQEGLGGIREVLINGNQEAYCKIYRNSDIPLRHAQGNSIFIGACPRYVMEALGMLIISFLAYMIAQQADGISKAIPILGAFALGAQRLLPVLQQAYGAWSSIQSGQAILKDTLEMLEQPLPKYESQKSLQTISFDKEIKFNKLSFHYNSQTPDVLNQISFTITKGSRVGFVGVTGSGKSTLIDILMGLLQPTDGSLEIDGKVLSSSNMALWQQHISHVPQTIYLTDSTVEENIAFGVSREKIDFERVKRAAQQAQIAESIESWPQQYQTFVGERGVRLSGGQRQRIGIARALYKQADVIVFDEATSALDNETEQSVMQAIESLSHDLTLIIVAHRLSTLKSCTQIIELGAGSIQRIGNYDEIVNNATNVLESKQGQ